MKKYIIIITLILSVGLFASEKLVSFGQAADFSLEDANGNVVKLSQFDDKLVVLDFWATWCVPCVKELPHLSALQEKYGNDIQVLAISIDKARKVSKAKAFVKSNDFKFTTLFDPKQEVAALYNMVNPPRTMIIDSNLNILWQHDGYKQGDEVHLETEIIKHLNNKNEIQNIAGSSLAISGINEFQYIYKAAEDSLKMYATESFKFNIRQNDFRFGMEFSGDFPKYHKFSPLENLEEDDLSYEWKNIYAEFNNETLTVRGGKYDLLIGSGMTMHAYNNTDLDEDYSLNGFYAKYKSKNLNTQVFYGVLPNKDNDKIFDTVAGADLELKPIKFFTVGLSALENQQYQNAENYTYNIRDIFSSRIKYTHNLFELNSEYAFSKQYHNEFGDEKEGHGFYSDLNLYLGKVTLTSAYKNYHNFHNRLNELPTANYSEKPLVDYGYDIGSDEQGVMNVIRFVPNDKNEFILNTAYGWSDKFDIDQVDIYAEYNHKFENWAMTTEWKHIESKWVEVTTDKWAKESTPALIFDFMLGDFSSHAKAELTINEHSSYTNTAIDQKDYEPLLQFDLGKDKYSVSILTSHKFEDLDNISDNDPKIGAEFVIQAWKHTDLKIFVGSEKGGLVCRNGVCNMQTPFKGARFSVTTRF